MLQTVNLPNPQNRKTVQSSGLQQDLSVVTYNILADFYLQSALAKGRYRHCPRHYVTPHNSRENPRHKLLITELQSLDGDIVCLQEVDPSYFEAILQEQMALLGYEGFFAQKAQCTGRQEGVAVFFKQDKFNLENARKRVINEIAAELVPQTSEYKEFGEVLILATLRHKSSGVLLLIGNTHILWGDLMKPVTQVCEIALVTQALHNAVTLLKSQGERVAYILCGDFNIDPNYPAYELLKEGKLNDDELAKLQTVDYLNFPSDCEKPKQVLPEQISLLHNIGKHLYNPLKGVQSAYRVLMGSEPECTSCEDDGSQVWTLDYIWFDSEHLKVTAALETFPESAIVKYGGFPNQHFPSDHFSLKAHFKLIEN